MARERLRVRASRGSELLRLDETVRRLKPFARRYVGIRAIPVDQIVGTLGRASDFDRRFVPRHQGVNERMRQIESTFPDGAFPPIVVYQLGDAYFVIDGHHRVALARLRRIRELDAEVTEFQTHWRMPAGADMATIIHAEQERWFEEASGLECSLPDVRIRLTRTADYVELLENVQIHGYHLMLEREQVLTRGDIAADWYKRIYAPVMEAIRREGAAGPDRTEGDLFLQLYRRRRERYADCGCPPLAETLPEATSAARPRWTWWLDRGRS